MIYQLTQYIDDEGRQIVEKTEVVDELIVPKSTRLGTFQVPHPMDPSGQGRVSLQLEFPDEFTLEKCFEDFDELAEEEYKRVIDEFKEEQIKRQILTPEDTGGIIVP